VTPDKTGLRTIIAIITFNFIRSMSLSTTWRPLESPTLKPRASRGLLTVTLIECLLRA
jgi:hypothetical protein